jgi:glycosyltransferase involved in cell wall biosynthesis
LRRIKVLHVITRLSVGGAPQNLLAIAGGLDGNRYEVSVVCGTGDPSEGSLMDRASSMGIPVRVVRGLQREIAPLKDALTFWRLLRLIRGGRYQIVHTHISKAGVLGRLAARAAGVPVIVHTYHGDVFRSYFSPLKSRALLAFEQAAAAVSDRLIEVSGATLERHAAYGVARPDRFAVIPNGIDLAPFTPPDAREARARLGLPPDAPVVGTVAMLVPVKRIDVLLAAMETVVRRLPGALLVIVGDGNQRTRLEGRAAATLSGRVRFLGLRENVQDLLPAFDAFALSSDDEGLPTSVMEAMAAGLPVVATAVGGVPEVVEHGQSGLLVPRQDIEALAEALVSLLEAPDRARAMGLRGRQIARERFDVRRLVARVDALYRELLREKGIET